MALAFLVLLVAGWFLLTSPAPLFATPPAPNAAQVAAGRDAYRQLRGAQNNSNRRVALNAENLAGLGLLASHGFAPDRLRLALRDGQLVAEASHRLPLGRWLNVVAAAQPSGEGFPTTRLKVGLVPLPTWLSRAALESGRLLLMVRGVDLPPLHWLVREMTIQRETVTALIRLPSRTGVIDTIAGVPSNVIDNAQVTLTYCALARRQRAQPSGDFAEQVRRAFSLPDGGNPAAANRAAFIALAMLLVDERTASFGGSAREDAADCRMPIVSTQLFGRADWPKHWSLSAAIAVGAGVQLSEAVGEWKELADSLQRNAEFSVGDPTGFSMADLTADRAGFLTAEAAGDAARARDLRERLAQAKAEDLLPPSLLANEDGLSSDAFEERYGGIDDPRFKARVRAIDAVLKRSPVR